MSIKYSALECQCMSITKRKPYIHKIFFIIHIANFKERNIFTVIVSIIAVRLQKQQPDEVTELNSTREFVSLEKDEALKDR
ncbi:hypothetical protein P5673_021261 [Acropora cervicornis]|uniref:Uncharacterized protein n=1 Tax=Acropora cervicornis TaxID=6130 RepID=A0AAD9Q8Q9_ACRCE|nr:hypothetical protein P5673_021261 [Acropora cervicornis]